MARHAQPRELAELKGAAKHDPQRYRNEVPKSDVPLGNAPDDMSDGEKAAWFEISCRAIPGVLTHADGFMVELAASLLAEYRENRREMVTSRIQLLVGVLARLGLSPSDRTKLGMESPKEENHFDNLDA